MEELSFEGEKEKIHSLPFSVRVLCCHEGSSCCCCCWTVGREVELPIDTHPSRVLFTGLCVCLLIHNKELLWSLSAAG